MTKRGTALYAVCAGLLLFAAASLAATADVSKAVAPEGAAMCAGHGASEVPPGTDDVTPACRMEPQCSTNADCVVWCGPAGGHCVHNSCPTRICKCS